MDQLRTDQEILADVQTVIDRAKRLELEVANLRDELEAAKMSAMNTSNGAEVASRHLRKALEKIASGADGDTPLSLEEAIAIAKAAL